MKKMIIVMFLIIASMMSLNVMSATLNLSDMDPVNTLSVQVNNASTVQGIGPINQTVPHLWGLIANTYTNTFLQLAPNSNIYISNIWNVSTSSYLFNVPGQLLSSYSFAMLSGVQYIIQVAPISLGASTLNTYTLTATATTPIPAAVWLFGSGFLGLIGFARRKKNSVLAA